MRFVLEVDLDWRSVLWVLGSFVALLALTGLVRGATRAFTWLVLGTLLLLTMGIVAMTGFLSHAAYQPDLPGNAIVDTAAPPVRLALAPNRSPPRETHP